MKYFAQFEVEFEADSDAEASAKCAQISITNAGQAVESDVRLVRVVDEASAEIGPATS